jgi:cysteine desulfurase
MTPLYFDNHATTAVDPRVVQAMLPTFTENFGNPGSGHAFGWRASAAVERATEQTAALIGAAPPEIEFTSGATSSIRRALLDTVNGEHLHFITAATEHRATLETFEELARLGHETTILPVDREGRITAAQVLAAVRSNTALVSLMHANNEIGTIHPITEIGSALRAARSEILFHVDAAQTAGRHEIDVDKMNIDLLSLSAHKMHGPKGVGALYHRSRAGRRVHLRERHAGTANVSGIVGLGAACEIARIELSRDQKHMSVLRDQIIAALTAYPQVSLNGPLRDRLCNNVNVLVEGIEPERLLNDIAFSSGSACAGPTESHVLKAIGVPTDNPSLTTMRFGLSRFTTAEEVSSLLERFRALTEKP